MEARASLSLSLLFRLGAYWQLTKPRLSVLVVFSAAMGALLAGAADGWAVLSVLLGGYGITGSANAANQLWERQIDALMIRTRQRPLAAGLISPWEAVAIGSLLGFLGILLLARLNWLCTLTAVGAWLIYVFLYTPLKKAGVGAVGVGAVAGALPPVIGYWAIKPEFSTMPALLFTLQFLWQFPHFWLIAWLARQDYPRAGIWLLPFSPDHPEANKRAIQLATGLPLLGALLWTPFLDWPKALWICSLSLLLSAYAFHRIASAPSPALRYLMPVFSAYLALLYLGLWVISG
ncbi:MAG: protoheme IX farnesyltransferase [Bacteroidia bacterium]|nr:protoheme IX farnesyltransferase [Bacteroidia bacterium]MDW8088137.1 protoheme IX farnesyltransferase [Bacteroidia bacterium]